MDGRGRLIVGVAILAVMVPAVALAGKTVVVGQQSLKVKATLSSVKAGARGVTLTLDVQYRNPKHPAQQPPYNSKDIIFKEPAGSTINTSAFPTCLESTVVKANGAATGCPAGSVVGHGTIVANARPTFKQLINATLTLYNGINDRGYDGFRPGSRILVFYVKTSIGLNTSFIFHIVKTRSGATELISKTSKPKKPGVTPGTFSLQRVHLTVAGKSPSGKPYGINPPTCTGRWQASMTITNWFGGPTITASDSINCRR